MTSHSHLCLITLNMTLISHRTGLAGKYGVMLRQKKTSRKLVMKRTKPSMPLRSYWVLEGALGKRRPGVFNRKTVVRQSEGD